MISRLIGEKMVGRGSSRKEEFFSLVFLTTNDLSEINFKNLLLNIGLYLIGKTKKKKKKYSSFLFLFFKLLNMTRTSDCVIARVTF